MTSWNAWEARIVAVPCPTCEAVVGEWCYALTPYRMGRGKQRIRNPHEARQEAADQRAREELSEPSGLTPGGSCRVYPDTGPEMPGAVTLRERVSEAIGAQTHYLAADAALTVCAAWLREQAETAEVHDTDRAVMRYLAEWIEEGKA
jgi:hypothetical protein